MSITALLVRPSRFSRTGTQNPLSLPFRTLVTLVNLALAEGIESKFDFVAKGILNNFSYILFGTEAIANTVYKNIGNLFRRILFALTFSSHLEKVSHLENQLKSK